ncbi:MAG: ankyrin repeat domain-containing protein [Azonexus sp.]
MADILFDEGSSKISRVESDKLELLACRMKGSGYELEVALVVGHADLAEKDAERLGWYRIAEVKETLTGMGFDSSRIYVENKGNKRPVSQFREKPAANRRVEIEVLFDLRKPTGASSQACGDFRWKHQLLSLEPEQALIVARNLIRDGGMKTITPFLEAVTTKRLDFLRALLARESGLFLGAEDRVVLFKAVVETGNAEWIQALIDFGIKLAEFRSHNELLSKAACAGGSNQSNQEAVHLLLAWGTKPASVARDRTYLPLECATYRNDMRVVDLLLEAGASPNEPTGLVATNGGKRDMVYRLLRAGGDPLAQSTYQTWEGRTLFHTFRMEKPADVEWLLSLGLDINALDKNGNTPLHEAVGYASEEVLDAMLKSGASLRESREESLLSGAYKNPIAMIWLIRRGAPLGKNGYFLTGLISDEKKNLPVIKELVGRGIDINQKNFRGETPLATAITRFQPAIVRYLLQVGADQKQMGNGLSALQLAESLEIAIPQHPRSVSLQKPTLLISPERINAKKEIIDMLGGSKR